MRGEAARLSAVVQGEGERVAVLHLGEATDRARATPTFWAWVMSSVSGIWSARPASVSVSASDRSGSKASGRTSTSRTTVPPAEATAAVRSVTTRPGASGMVTNATRTSRSAPSITGSPACCVVGLLVLIERVAAIDLVPQLGHLLAVLRGLAEQALVHRRAQRDPDRDADGQGDEHRHQRDDVVTEVDHRGAALPRLT